MIEFEAFVSRFLVSIFQHELELRNINSSLLRTCSSFEQQLLLLQHSMHLHWASSTVRRAVASSVHKAELSLLQVIPSLLLFPSTAYALVRLAFNILRLLLSTSKRRCWSCRKLSAVMKNDVVVWNRIFWMFSC
jgi:hypothetical protein